MSSDEYWHGDPVLARAYREKHMLEVEQKNQELWLQGLYIYDAVAVAIGNAFSKRKQKYIEKPIRITPLTDEEKEQKAKEERQKVVEYLNAFAANWNAKNEPQKVQ